MAFKCARRKRNVHSHWRPGFDWSLRPLGLCVWWAGGGGGGSVARHWHMDQFYKATIYFYLRWSFYNRLLAAQIIKNTPCALSPSSKYLNPKYQNGPNPQRFIKTLDPVKQRSLCYASRIPPPHPPTPPADSRLTPSSSRSLRGAPCAPKFASCRLRRSFCFIYKRQARSSRSDEEEAEDKSSLITNWRCAADREERFAQPLSLRRRNRLRANTEYDRLNGQQEDFEEMIDAWSGTSYPTCSLSSVLPCKRNFDDPLHNPLTLNIG